MTGGTGGLGDEVRVEALHVLSDALQWRLTEAPWAAVGSTVDPLATALRVGDDRAVRSAVAELEHLGPVSATPIGRELVVPCMDPVREEINELVHALDDPKPSP